LTSMGRKMIFQGTWLW